MYPFDDKELLANLLSHFYQDKGGSLVWSFKSDYPLADADFELNEQLLEFAEYHKILI